MNPNPQSDGSSSPAVSSPVVSGPVVSGPAGDASLPFSPAANESTKAFEAFLGYFDIGQTRSLAKVAKLSGVTLSTVKKWADRFGWRERVRAYNIHLLRTRLAVETDARRNRAELQAERTRIFEDAEWKAAEKLLRVSHIVLDVLLQTPPEKLSLSDVARALDIASKVGRLATGLATEQVDHGGEVNVNLQVEIESAIKKVYGPVLDVPSAPAPNVGQVSQPAGAADFPVRVPSTPQPSHASATAPTPEP